MDSLIKLENVSIKYKLKSKMNGESYFEPLRCINFELFRGETLGVIGRNGAGKSTLLKLLSKIYTPDSGVIKYQDGITVSLLTLQAGFDPELSGLDNILFSSLVLGFDKKKIEQQQSEIIEMSELGNFIHQPVKTYSSGMKSKLGFAIAVQMSPDVLLIDEALSVGDSKFKKKAEKIMVDKINSDQTVVFVSHSSSQVERLCDRVVWIENKVVRMVGEPKSVVKAYEAE